MKELFKCIFQKKSLLAILIVQEMEMIDHKFVCVFPCDIKLSILIVKECCVKLCIDTIQSNKQTPFDN